MISYDAHIRSRLRIARVVMERADKRAGKTPDAVTLTDREYNALYDALRDISRVAVGGMKVDQLHRRWR